MEQRAFYYVRVLENPVCRWSTWDSIREGVEPRSDIPSTIQERLFYLENQIGLESNERILKNIEIDKLQPDYQM